MRNLSYNQLAAKLISQSGAISEESSAVPDSEDEPVKQIDVLYVVGVITNVREVD